VSRDVSRRDLLRAGGAGALGYATLGLTGAAAQRPARMNVVVVVMDSLRADHVYGHRARTAAWDKLGHQGVRFLNAHPEAMPTIPARRSIMSGRRVYPFRGWHPFPNLPPQPGWEPVGIDGEMWTVTLG
jgi:arylsulfatase A-like enzyme